jgi:hypothetical protein
MSFPTGRMADLLASIESRRAAMCADGKTALAAAQDTLAELVRVSLLNVELDDANADLAGRLQTAEEQLESRRLEDENLALRGGL